VLALTSPYLWYTARATGEVSLVLLTATLVLGALVATRVGGDAVGRFEINELHRSVSVLAILFVALHVTVTVIDSYVPIGLFSALVPLTSSYRRLPVALGTIAIDLMLLIWVTSLLKDRIRFATWRTIHWLSWLCFFIAALHGFVTGSDARRPWSIALTASCVGLVVLAGAWRLAMRPNRAAGRTAHSPLQLRKATTHVARNVPPRPQPASTRPVPPPAPPRRTT
jgi:predicted ferric reductase